MDFTLYNPKKALNPFGLKNPHNLCYLNSLIQGLMSCTSIIETMEMDEHIYNENIVGNALIHTMQFARNTVNHPNITINDMGIYVWQEMFKGLITKISEDINLRYNTKQEMTQDILSSKFRQNDPAEAYGWIMDIMTDIRPFTFLFEYKFEDTIHCLDCKNSYLSIDVKEEPGRESDLLSNIFMVNADLTIDSLENLMGNSQIGNTKLGSYTVSKQTKNLQDFLFVQNQHLDKDYKCRKCPNTDNIFKSTKLCMIPEILFILSKKYDNMGQKLDTYTDFPLTLQFQGKSNIGLGVSPTFIYEAVAQIDHLGSTKNSGHYYGIFKRQGGWFKIDDDDISTSEFKPTKNTYIVIYHIMRVKQR